MLNLIQSRPAKRHEFSLITTLSAKALSKAEYEYANEWRLFAYLSLLECRYLLRFMVMEAAVDGWPTEDN